MNETDCTDSAAGACNQNSLSKETSGIKDGHFEQERTPYQVIHI